MANSNAYIIANARNIGELCTAGRIQGSSLLSLESAGENDSRDATAPLFLTHAGVDITLRLVKAKRVWVREDTMSSDEHKASTGEFRMASTANKTMV